MILALVLYGLAALGLFVYGMNAYVLVRSFHRHRDRELERLRCLRREFAERVGDDDLPAVTVQLPVYDERFVVRRLLEAVARLDWPREKIDVQVLDDSTDDTAEIVARTVARLRGEGLRIEHLRRDRRDGYKAGALRDGLERSDAELVAIFDADFVPEPDFLRRTVPLFVDERVGLVQARWGHLNRDHSALTRAQAVAIDGHFAIEQAGRRWGGFFLNFNGTAGVWRRKAIDDAGGWRADTLTEDLDLSYRAQLAGYRIEYAIDVEVPAEIPADVPAFKSQQRRWAKGSIQTARKLLPAVFRAPLRPLQKVQAALHLTAYMIHPLMLTVVLLALPVSGAWSWSAAPVAAAIFGVLVTISAAGPSVLYACAQRALRPDWGRRILWLPVLMVVGTGIAVANTRAVLEALLGLRSEFVRTPKRALGPGAAVRPARAGYRLPFDLTAVVEALLAVYCAGTIALLVRDGRWLAIPFLLLFVLGFSTMAAGTILDSLRGRRRVAAPVREDALPADPELAYAAAPETTKKGTAS